MESRVLKAIKFMTQSQYASSSKENNNLYLVEFKPDISMFPNYTSGISLNKDTNYTVGSGALADYSSGWFRIGLTSSSWHGRSPQITITVNSLTFYINYGCAFTMIYVSTGDKIKYSYPYNDTGHTTATCRSNFFPVRAS